MLISAQTFSSQKYSASPQPFWIHSGSFLIGAAMSVGGYESADILLGITKKLSVLSEGQKNTVSFWRLDVRFIGQRTVAWQSRSGSVDSALSRQMRHPISTNHRQFRSRRTKNSDSSLNSLFCALFFKRRKLKLLFVSLRESNCKMKHFFEHNSPDTVLFRKCGD